MMSFPRYSGERLRDWETSIAICKLLDLVRSGGMSWLPIGGVARRAEGGSTTVYWALFDGRWHAPFRCARNGASLDFSVATILKIQFACTYCFRHFPRRGKQVATMLILTTFVFRSKVLLIEIRNTRRPRD